MPSITAPTPVTIPAVSAIVCNQMQAEKIVVQAYGGALNGNSAFAASAVLSYYADDGNGGKIFAFTPTGTKVTSNLSITDLFAQAEMRAEQGNPALANAITAFMTAIENEFTLQQQEQAAVTAAQAALTAAQAQLATDQAANAAPSVIAADQAAVSAAQSALAAAKQQAAPATS